MAKAEAKKDDKVYARVELKDAIDESLGEDDVWNDIIEENEVPDFVIKGHRIRQPTKEQVDAWSDMVSRNEPDPEVALMSREVYEELKAAFKPLPLSAWRNFQQKFTNHVFGLTDTKTLGK